MRSRGLVMFLVPAALICVFVSHAPAAPKTVDLESQVRALDVSKAVPGQLSYQGFLANAIDSSAVSGSLEMTFRLYDSETKGAELWSETHPSVAVSGGLFQVPLGSQTAFPDGLFDGSSLWLQTEIGSEILGPRKPVVSTAYSHRANSAEMLLDYSLTDLDSRWVNEDQANSITSSMITDGEIVDGDVSATADIHPGKVAGTAWTADNDGTGSGLDADMVDGLDSGDFLSAAIDYGRSGVATDLYEGVTTLGDKYVHQDELNHLDAADGDPVDAVYIDDDGKVGIGTDSPTAELDVNGSVNATTYYGDGSHLTGISGTTDGDWTISGSDIYSAVPGNVGIGLTIPTAKLDVVGTTRMGNPVASFTSSVGLGIIANDATSASNPLVVINPSEDHIFYVKGDGTVGIGTSTPGSPLEVSYDNWLDSSPAIAIDNTHGLGAQDVLDFSFTGTTQARIRKANNGDMFLGTVVSDGLNLITNDANRLTVASNGQVGIGTDNPDYLLDVAGDAGFDQYLYHNGDEDTYVRFTSDQIDLYAGEVWLLSAEETTQDEVVINDGSADVDFRVESDDNAYALWVRGSDGSIGMGTSNPNYKLDVQSSSGTGARFQTTNNSSSSYGCRGEAMPSGNYNAKGVYGYCVPADWYGYGIYGLGGYIGVRGEVAQTGGGGQGYFGVRGYATLSSGLGTVCGVYGYGSGGFEHYGVYYSGGLGGSGSKSAIVRTAEGPKAVYCQESPENWFEDFGSGKIYGGRSEILLADDFRQTITVNTSHSMKVFITPNERIGEWWVEKGTDGFMLVAPDASEGATFDYRVVAKRRGYEHLRLAPAPTAYADHYLYPDVADVPPQYRQSWLRALPAEDLDE